MPSDLASVEALLRERDGMTRTHRETIDRLTAEITALRADLDRTIAERDEARARAEKAEAAAAGLAEALNASVQFADIVADNLDLDMVGTVIRIKVMPSGRTAATRSWSEVQDDARTALAAYAATGAGDAAEERGDA